MAKKRNWVLNLGLGSVLGLVALAGLASSQNGCVNNSPMSYNPGPTATPGGGVTPTPGGTPTPVAVNIGGGNTFSPNAISIPSGAAVSFNLSAIHTVHIDDGTGSGTCGSTDYSGTWPFVYSGFTGASGTVYRVHCDNHSTCTGSASTSCSGCTGMVMTVTIQ